MMLSSSLFIFIFFAFPSFVIMKIIIRSVHFRVHVELHACRCTRTNVNMWIDSFSVQMN
jgi:hypothetical protein